MKTLSIDRTPRLLRDLTAATKGGIITLTRKGKPVAYILSARQYDEEDIGYMTDPEFWRMIRERRTSDDWVPFETVKADLLTRERIEHARRSGRAANKLRKSHVTKGKRNGSA
ncbi:MAG: type II toxin-antitoxin system prevent-host-death family antitoxin [Planctomycetota bacterium]|nr:type II toxin-antitoxin system prevent-host-death family antitoxin [Planctomycetota bacterium]